MIWAVPTRPGQTPDRLWHDAGGAPFQIAERLFTPAWMREATPEEIEAAGGVVTASEPASGGEMDMATMSDEDLRAYYELVLGEKPHHAAKRETLIERITAKLNED